MINWLIVKMTECLINNKSRHHCSRRHVKGLTTTVWAALLLYRTTSVLQNVIVQEYFCPENFFF